jgi:tetraacyldisaccharide 4'-kinase
MNFNSFFLRSFRILLLPFALIYALIVFLRNVFYDNKIFKSATFNFPLICVGNLAVGGTGKSPMVEYLAELLLTRYRVGTLSRGYKRKTKGYALANVNTTAIDIGDEPMQFHLKFPNMPVAVGEERIVAIPQLLHDHPELDAIILDDAFQHRMVNAGLNIILTEYSNLFTEDFYLPTGDLRDERRSYKRANVILVTKCPADLNEEEKQRITKDIHPLSHQHIFFTTIDYGVPYHIVHNVKRNVTENDEVLLVCGIANPRPLKQYLFDSAGTYYQIDYRDHHIFTIDDLSDIIKRFENITADSKFILTTEKDAVRLSKFKQQLTELPLYVLPIRHRFLFNEESGFNNLIFNYIANFKVNTSNEQEKGKENN